MPTGDDSPITLDRGGVSRAFSGEGSEDSPVPKVRIQVTGGLVAKDGKRRGNARGSGNDQAPVLLQREIFGCQSCAQVGPDNALSAKTAVDLAISSVAGKSYERRPDAPSDRDLAVSDHQRVGVVAVIRSLSTACEGPTSRLLGEGR